MTQTRMKHTSVTRMGAVAVVKPHHRLTGDEETDEFREIVRELNDEKLRCLIINLADVDWVNSPGLGALVDAHQRFSKRGAFVHLAEVDKRIKNMFLITKLALVFDIYPSEETAIAGCVAKSAPAET